MPVIVPFFLSLDIDMNGVYLLTVFIFEIPSGYISDLLGRKNTLVVAHMLKAVGFSMFPFAESIELLIVAEVILGVAVSLSSGTDTALIYDTMEIVSPQKAQIKVLGRSVYFQTMGEGMASLIASVLMLLAFDIHNLAYISAVISWIPMCVAMTLVEPPRTKMTSTHKENIGYIYRSLFKQSKLLNLILINAIFSFTGTLTAVWMFQKYWQELGINVVYFGFLWAITNFTVSFVSKSAHKLEKKIGSVAALLLIGLLPPIGYLGISFVDHLYGIVFCLCFQVCRGLGQVIYNDALNKRVTTDFRATANSIMQMGVRIIFIGLGPLFGHLIDTRGLSFATRSIGSAYIGILIIFLIPLIKERQNFIGIKK